MKTYEFQKNGRGIFYDNLSNMSNVECFDYTYNASAGTIVMKWHEDTGKPNWDSPIVETMNGTVRVLSNDKVIVTVNGYTMTLTRQNDKSPTNRPSLPLASVLFFYPADFTLNPK